jgi:hypothetical protein
MTLLQLRKVVPRANSHSALLAGIPERGSAPADSAPARATRECSARCASLTARIAPKRPYKY